MTDITIVNLFYDTGDAESRVGYVPIGPLYVAAALEEAGYRVDFRDYLVGSANYTDPMDPASVYSFLAHSAGIIGISCAGELLPLAILAVQQLKNVYPDKTIIFGGIGAAGAAEDILGNFPFVDIVVRGEGERTAVELMKCLESGRGLENVRGISYRKGSEIRSNPGRERIDTLDELPFPAYHKIDIADYANVAIYSARGCPYRCTFCEVAPFWGRRYYPRSIGDTVEELVLLREKYNRQKIDIMDDILVLDRKRILDLCRAIKERELEFQWGCCGRIDLMDEELMARMSNSGCRMIFYGVESGSDKVLKITRKGFTRQQAKEVILKSREYFHVVVSLVWGFPFETMTDFYRTLELKDFVNGIGGEVDIYLLSALPLSRLYREHKKRLEFSIEKYGNMFGGSPVEVAGFIRKYPTLCQWFYRYPTENFQKKYRMAGYTGP